MREEGGLGRAGGREDGDVGSFETCFGPGVDRTS